MTAVGEAEGFVDLNGRVGAVLEKASRERLRPFEADFAVQHRHGLRSGNRLVPSAAGFVRIRHVEFFEHRVARIPSYKDIDAAAIALSWIGQLPASARLSCSGRKFRENA